MFCVDKGNGDPRSFAIEAVSPKPGGVHVGVDEVATSRGGIEAAQTKLSEPPPEQALTLGFEANIEFGPLKGQMKGYMRSRIRRTSCLGPYIWCGWRRWEHVNCRGTGE